MDNLASLMQGFADLATLEVLLWSVVGVLLGTLIGALPGLGPVAGIAVLLPLSFTLETVPALVLLMATYQAASKAGRISPTSTTVPAEPTPGWRPLAGFP